MPLIFGPNIMGKISTTDNEPLIQSDTGTTWSGSLSVSDKKTADDAGAQSVRGSGYFEIDFNASTSNNLFGKSNTLQPAASQVLIIIKV